MTTVATATATDRLLLLKVAITISKRNNDNDNATVFLEPKCKGLHLPVHTYIQFILTHYTVATSALLLERTEHILQQPQRHPVHNSPLHSVGKEQG